MAKRKNRSLMKQKIAVGALAVVVIGIFAYFYTLVVAEAPGGEFVEGDHYSLVDSPRRVRGDKVEVMEFFSYACPHCFEFDPKIRDWVADHKDKIEFVRTPAVGSNEWRFYAKAYYAMEQLGIVEQDHAKLFNTLHTLHRNLGSLDKLANWIDGQGTTAAAFKQAFNSADVENRVEMADRMGRRFKIVSVPSVIIDGKYLVHTSQEIGLNRMLDVMNYLVSKEVNENKASTKPAKP